MDKYDIIVIGGGPAGLTAALYGLRAGKKVLVLEGKAIGGQIVNALNVQNYPGVPSVSGVELTTNMYKQVQEFGGEVKFERATKIEVEKGVEQAPKNTVEGSESVSTAVSRSISVITDGGKYNASAVILATGAENRKLGLPREEEMVGKGVSYCATCDGNFFRGKDVAVIGGGNTALEDAVYLSPLASKVYLVHRRDEFRGDATNVEKVKACDNIELVLKANATEILGEKKVEGLRVKYDDGTERVLEVSGIFFAVGYIPQNQEFADVVELDEAGYIKTDDGVHTSCLGVYVAGDARAKDLKQLTTAVSDGSIAATVAIHEMD